MRHDEGVGPLVYRPTLVRLLSVVTWALLAVVLVATAAADPLDGLRWAPVLALVAALAYAMFWRPSVEVDDDAVTVRNVVRDVRVPWQRLESVDTRYSLMLEAGGRRYAAWAAPAPGRLSGVRQSRRDAAALAALGADLDHGLRASAVPNSDSGGAAIMVRARWEQAGSAARRTRDAEPTQVRWAPVPLVALAVTAAATVVAVLLG
jgi:hypothetical protein